MSDPLLWIVAHHVPLSMVFSRQEYWSVLLCPSPRDLPEPGIEPASLTSPAFAGGFFTTSTSWDVHVYIQVYVNIYIYNYIYYL